MKTEGYKTRFTKPYQIVTIQVPYDTGMDPYNGLLEVAVELGVISQKGAWFYFGDEKWNGKLLPVEHSEAVLAAVEDNREKFLEGIVEDDEELAPDDKRSVQKQRRSKTEPKD